MFFESLKFHGNKERSFTAHAASLGGYGGRRYLRRPGTCRRAMDQPPQSLTLGFECHFAYPSHLPSSSSISNNRSWSHPHHSHLAQFFLGPEFGAWGNKAYHSSHLPSPGLSYCFCGARSSSIPSILGSVGFLFLFLVQGGFWCFRIRRWVDRLDKGCGRRRF